MLNYRDAIREVSADFADSPARWQTVPALMNWFTLYHANIGDQAVRNIDPVISRNCGGGSRACEPGRLLLLTDGRTNYALGHGCLFE